MSEQLNSLERLLTQVLTEQITQTGLLQRMADQQLMLIQALAGMSQKTPMASRSPTWIARHAVKAAEAMQCSGMQCADPQPSLLIATRIS